MGIVFSHALFLRAKCFVLERIEIPWYYYLLDGKNLPLSHMNMADRD